MKRLKTSSIKTLFFILAFSLFAFWAEPAICEQPKKRDYWPTQDWKTSTPELQGMDPAKLSVADEFIENRLLDAYSLLVVKNGYLVFEKYYSYGGPHKIALVHSVTKSVTSALIGIALEKGHLKSLDQRLSEFFPEYMTGDLDPRKKEIRLKHLLTMSAGFRWDDRGPSMRNWYTSSNWIRNAIHLPQDHYPGDRFNYNSSTSHLLSAIVSKSVGTNTLAFAKKNLFDPVGITSAYWHRDPQGVQIGGFGMGLSARDLAKFGFLYLNDGYWDGQSIVPEHWVAASTSEQIEAINHPFYGPFGYGYQWWVKKVDGLRSFRAWGRRGQYVAVIPELDLVVVVTSNPVLPHPPTSIHYCPLFDLVAAAVKRERPSKKSPVAVELPADVAAFISNYDTARTSMDIATMAESISDRFLYNGVTKSMALEFLAGTLSYTAASKIVITRYAPDGDKVKLDVWLKDKYFEVPFMVDSRLIKENGRWLWYGNQITQ